MGDWGSIAMAGIFLGGLGTTLAGTLAFAQRRLYVYEDPRIDELENLLPRTNCGACGTPGCRAFAEALIGEKTVPAECTVCTPEQRQQIADYLGISVGSAEMRVARLACAGGSNVAWNRAHYDGLASCRAAAITGNAKGCVWGCLGLGDCEDVCDYDAIVMDRHGLPQVIEANCTACSDCVDICPKHLFSIHPVSHRLWVVCANQDGTEAARAVCEVVCDGCGRCAMDAAEGLIEIKNNLAVVDYARNPLASAVAIERCPTGAIIWWDEQRGPRHGPAAPKILHREALPTGAPATGQRSP